MQIVLNTATAGERFAHNAGDVLNVPGDITIAEAQRYLASGMAAVVEPIGAHSVPESATLSPPAAAMLPKPTPRIVQSPTAHQGRRRRKESNE